MNETVLVLNANYEPLNVCSTRRAIGLMMTGKAEALHYSRGFINSVTEIFPCPSIVRLARMIHRPHPRVKLSKREIFRRDNYTCQYCGRRGTSQELTIDHVLPRHRGGSHTWDNLVTSCPPCNRRKGGRTPLEAEMPLLTKPREPYASAVYLFGHMVNGNSEWKSYLNGW